MALQSWLLIKFRLLCTQVHEQEETPCYVSAELLNPVLRGKAKVLPPTLAAEPDKAAVCLLGCTAPWLTSLRTVSSHLCKVQLDWQSTTFLSFASLVHFAEDLLPYASYVLN